MKNTKEDFTIDIEGFDFFLHNENTFALKAFIKTLNEIDKNISEGQLKVIAGKVHMCGPETNQLHLQLEVFLESETVQ